MRNWESYERAAEKGPIGISMKVIGLVTLLAAVIGGISYGFGWIGEAAAVAKQELGPAALLRKYEWFKDASAQLDKKRADIDIYKVRVEATEAAYKDIPRHQWRRIDVEQYGQWLTEVAGVKASYNALAAEYNAQMAKMNWAFANIGQLPDGAQNPLPREYKPYATN